MSFQIAMMAGMAAMTVAQAAQSASKAGAAAGRQTASLHEAERNNAIEMNIARSETAIQKMGYEVQGAQYLTQAAQTDVTAAEVGIRTKQQELMRRRELARLGQANAIDLVARGGMATGQDSAGAIDEYNRAMAEEDVGNIRMMGDAAERQLSFRKSNLSLSAMGEGLRSIYAGLKGSARQGQGEARQRGLELQVGEAGAAAGDAAMDALLGAGGKLFSIGATYGSGKGEEKKDFRAGEGGHEP